VAFAVSVDRGEVSAANSVVEPAVLPSAHEAYRPFRMRLSARDTTGEPMHASVLGVLNVTLRTAAPLSASQRIGYKAPRVLVVDHANGTYSLVRASLPNLGFVTSPRCRRRSGSDTRRRACSWWTTPTAPTAWCVPPYPT
jgi:hypothetical protein